MSAFGGTPGLYIDFIEDSLSVIDGTTAANNYRGKASTKLTFTRASTASRFTAGGLIENVASDVMRTEYDPATLAPRGLLIEGARTNLLTYSEDLSNAAWTKSGASTGSPVSAKGVSLSLLVEDSATSTHQAQQGVSFTSGSTYSISVLAKAKERSRFALTLGASAFSGFAIGDFDLVAQTATSTGATAAACSITSIGDGVFRCVVTATATATAAANVFLQMSNGSTTYAGNGTSGMYFGAIQAELGAIPSSYIPTTSATVTRAAENCKIATTLFPATITGPYTIFAKGIMPLNNASDANRVIASLSTNSFAESRYFRRDNANSIILANVTGSAANAAAGNVAVSALANVKMAARIDLNNINAAINGTLGTNDTVCAYPSAPTQLNIGNLQDGGTSHWHGWIQQIAVIPVALTDAQLQAVTA